MKEVKSKKDVKCDLEKKPLKERLYLFWKGRKWNMWQTYLFLVLFSCALSFLEFTYAVGGTWAFVENIVKSPLVFFLNVFPILSTTLFLYFLAHSVRFSAIANFVFYNIIFIVNRIKILYRNEPLFVSDIRLGAESVTITKGQNYSPGTLMLLLSFFAFVLLLFVVFYFKSSKPKWRTSLIGMAVIILLGWMMYQNVYTSRNLYAKILPDVSVYSDRDSAENKGILYYLLYTLQFSHTKPPEGYDKKEFAGLQGGDVQMKARPNILMIMGEAYFDLSKQEIFSYPDGVSPTQQFDRLAKDALLAGRIIVPSFGGGTADTEFDVLTGCQTIRCAPNKTFAFNSVLDETNSIATALKKQGYFTRAFHPGYNFFYKRQTVYPRLGFDACYFEDSIENQILVSGYMQEKQTFDEYKRRLFEHVNGANASEPIFDYMVTIQNHGPYYRGKFGKNFKFECSIPLVDELRGCLEGFFQGVHEMDVEIGRLADAVEDSPEPYLLIFYGDHLPSLQGGKQSYLDIGFDISGDSFESEVRRHSTPYVIWANKSYRKMLSEQHGALLPPAIRQEEVSLISANYLGALVLQLVGADEGDDFYANLSIVRTHYPVLSRNHIHDGKKAYGYGEIGGEELKRYYRYQYYRLND